MCPLYIHLHYLKGYFLFPPFMSQFIPDMKRELYFSNVRLTAGMPTHLKKLFLNSPFMSLFRPDMQNQLYYSNETRNLNFRIPPFISQFIPRMQNKTYCSNVNEAYRLRTNRSFANTTSRLHPVSPFMSQLLPGMQNESSCSNVNEIYRLSGNCRFAYTFSTGYFRFSLLCPSSQQM